MDKISPVELADLLAKEMARIEHGYRFDIETLSLEQKEVYMKFALYAFEALDMLGYSVQMRQDE